MSQKFPPIRQINETFRSTFYCSRLLCFRVQDALLFDKVRNCETQIKSKHTYVICPRWSNQEVSFWAELHSTDTVIWRRLYFHIFHWIRVASKSKICLRGSGAKTTAETWASSKSWGWTKHLSCLWWRLLPPAAIYIVVVFTGLGRSKVVLTSENWFTGDTVMSQGRLPIWPLHRWACSSAVFACGYHIWYYPGCQRFS